MRERRQTHLPSVLALAFVTLLVTPIAATAASGLPPTISIEPQAAGPGTAVEVTGLNFPAGQPVDLRLTTSEGSVGLGTTTTETEGYFRAAVSLPAEATPGFWELRATAPDGSVAVQLFEAGAAGAGIAAAAANETAATAARGNSLADILVMLVIAVLIAAVGGGVALAWYQVHRDDSQPGMSTGEDPIWAGAPFEPLGRPLEH